MYRYSTAVFVLFAATAALGGTATITDAGAKNVGSSAAYVATCEKEQLLSTGTLADFMFELQRSLTPEHWRKVKMQYQLSLHEKTQYSIAKDQWIPFHISRESCADLGKALPMMKAALRRHSP